MNVQIFPKCSMFSKMIAPIYTLTSSDHLVDLSSPTIDIIRLSFFLPKEEHKMILYYCFYLHFHDHWRVWYDVMTISSYVCWTYEFPFCEISIKDLCLFFLLICRCFCALDTNPLSIVYVMNIFSWFVIGLFIFFKWSLDELKFLF